MKKISLIVYCLLSFVLLCLPKNVLAQSVGIGTITPNVSAQLDITSIEKLESLFKK
jgi:hypothetical protein